MVVLTALLTGISLVFMMWNTSQIPQSKRDRLQALAADTTRTYEEKERVLKFYGWHKEIVTLQRVGYGLWGTIGFGYLTALQVNWQLTLIATALYAFSRIRNNRRAA